MDYYASSSWIITLAALIRTWSLYEELKLQSSRGEINLWRCWMLRPTLIEPICLIYTLSAALMCSCTTDKTPKTNNANVCRQTGGWERWRSSLLCLAGWSVFVWAGGTKSCSRIVKSVKGLWNEGRADNNALLYLLTAAHGSNHQGYNHQESNNPAAFKVHFWFNIWYLISTLMHLKRTKDSASEKKNGLLSIPHHPKSTVDFLLPLLIALKKKVYCSLYALCFRDIETLPEFLIHLLHLGF